MKSDASTAQPINPAALGEVIPADFLPPIRRWQRLGGLTGVVTVVMALALSQVVTFRETVKADVVLRPAGELRLVEATAAGRISQIVVQENDQVNAEDAIAYLDDTQLQTKTVQLQNSAIQIEQQLTQTDYQLQSLRQRIAATVDNTQGKVRATAAELTLTQKQLRENQLVNQANFRQLQAEINLAQENVDRYRQLVDQGAIAISQLRAYEVALETAHARFQKAQATAQPSYAAVTIVQQQMAQTQAQGRALVAQLQQEENTLKQQRSDLLDQLNQTQQQLTQAKADMSLLVLRAPVSGTIQSLQLRNHGQVVTLGNSIAQIAADDAPLVAKAWVAPQDINAIESTQPVHLRISACPYTDYGTLEAKIQAISPDTLETLPNSISNPGENGLYEITLKLLQPAQKTKQNACNVQTGMTGQADFLTREETLFKLVWRKLRLTTQL